MVTTSLHRLGFSYHVIGNPRTYRDGITFTWSNGKQLDTLTRGTTTADYNYDNSGLRISKTANGVEYTYLTRKK